MKNSIKNRTTLMAIFLMPIAVGCPNPKNLKNSTTVDCDTEALLKQLDAANSELEEIQSQHQEDTVTSNADLTNCSDTVYLEIENTNTRLEKPFDLLKLNTQNATEYENDLLPIQEDSQEKIELSKTMNSKIENLTNGTKTLRSNLKTATASTQKLKVNMLKLSNDTEKTLNNTIVGLTTKINNATTTANNEIENSRVTIDDLEKNYEGELKNITDGLHEQVKSKEGKKNTNIEKQKFLDSKNQEIKEGGTLPNLCTKLQELRNGGYKGDGNRVPDSDNGDPEKIGGLDPTGTISLAEMIHRKTKEKNKSESLSGIKTATERLQSLCLANEEKLKELNRKLAPENINNEYTAYITKRNTAPAEFKTDLDYNMRTPIKYTNKTGVEITRNGAVNLEIEKIREEIEDIGLQKYRSEVSNAFARYGNAVANIAPKQIQLEVDENNTRINAKKLVDDTYNPYNPFDRVNSRNNFDKLVLDEKAQCLYDFKEIKAGNNSLIMSLRNAVESSTHLGDEELQNTIKEFTKEIRNTCTKIIDAEKNAQTNINRLTNDAASRISNSNELKLKNSTQTDLVNKINKRNQAELVLNNLRSELNLAPGLLATAELNKNSEETTKLNKIINGHQTLIDTKDQEIKQLNDEIKVQKEKRDAAAQAYFLFEAKEEVARDKNIQVENNILEKLKGPNDNPNFGLFGARIQWLKQAICIAQNERIKNAKKHGYALWSPTLNTYINDLNNYLGNKPPTTDINKFSLISDLGNLMSNTDDTTFSKSAGTTDPNQMMELAMNGLYHNNFTKKNYKAKLEYEVEILNEQNNNYLVWQQKLKDLQNSSIMDPSNIENGIKITVNYETWRLQEGDARIQQYGDKFENCAGHLTAIDSIAIETQKVDPNDKPNLKTENLLGETANQNPNLYYNEENEIMFKTYNFNYGYSKLYYQSKSEGTIDSTYPAPQPFAPAYANILINSMGIPGNGNQVEAY